MRGLAAQHRVRIEPTPPAPETPALTDRSSASQRRDPPSELSVDGMSAAFPSLRCDRPSNLHMYTRLWVRTDHAAAPKPARKCVLTRCVCATLCFAATLPLCWLGGRVSGCCWRLPSWISRDGSTRVRDGPTRVRDGPTRGAVADRQQLFRSSRSTIADRQRLFT